MRRYGSTRFLAPQPADVNTRLADLSHAGRTVPCEGRQDRVSSTATCRDRTAVIALKHVIPVRLKWSIMMRATDLQGPWKACVRVTTPSDHPVCAYTRTQARQDGLRGRRDVAATLQQCYTGRTQSRCGMRATHGRQGLRPRDIAEAAERAHRTHGVQLQAVSPASSASSRASSRASLTTGAAVRATAV